MCYLVTWRLVINLKPLCFRLLSIHQCNSLQLHQVHIDEVRWARLNQTCLEHLKDSDVDDFLVVSNMFIFHNIWDNPSH